ncbi:COP9 signalosome complex subunit 3 [Sarocladium implicatum]|nr:COP9 signalosome complex subunit 3 [Sarocladium implicatum]
MDKLQTILKGSTPRLILDQKTYKEQDQELRSHADSVAKLPETARALITAQPRDVLEWLSPVDHSISYSIVLDVLLQTSRFDDSNEHEWLRIKIEEFARTFDWIHVRFCGDALRDIVNRIMTGGLFPFGRALDLYSTIALRVDPSGSVFTSLHLLAANLALAAGDPDLPLQVLENDITAYPAPSSLRAGRPLSDPDLSPTVYISLHTGLTEHVKANDVLDYGAVMGSIYIRRKDWTKARASLEKVITHPTKDKRHVSSMTRAYKRWILVSLLEGGKSPTLPSYTPSAAKMGYAQPPLAPYNALAAAFDNSDPAQMQTELSTHSSSYEEDGLAELVQDVVNAYQMWQVINLRTAYSRISVSRIREETFSAVTGQRLASIEAMATLIRDMISSGMLNAHFELDEHGNETYVAFTDATQTLSETEFAKEIAKRHLTIQNLTAQYKAANDRLTGHKEYAKHIYKEQKRQAEDGNQNGGFEMSVDDEDLMAGVVRAS